MVLSFLRHAEAEPDAGADFDRKLTPKGLEQAEKVGRFLVRYGLIPGLILSSPVIRAKQTARLIAGRLGDARVEIVDWLACGMTPQTCLESLEDYTRSESVMLVGHEPDFSETIAAFVGLTDSEGINIRKASLTNVDLPSFSFGVGQLQYSLPVRLM